MFERYQRQIIIESIGESGQAKLCESRVLVVGAGGLGSPVLFYLCAAGIGNLGIIDYEKVEISNLNRQILYTEADVSEYKAAIAAKKLHAQNPSVNFLEYTQKLTKDNIANIFPGYDVIVDCVDNITTRMLVAHACHDLGITLVEGGIHGFSGFVMSIQHGTACLGCLIHSKTEYGETIPALGATAGVAGSIQAAECIKLLLGIGEPLLNEVLFFDLMTQDFKLTKLLRSPLCPVCGHLYG